MSAVGVFLLLGLLVGQADAFLFVYICTGHCSPGQVDILSCHHIPSIIIYCTLLSSFSENYCLSSSYSAFALARSRCWLISWPSVLSAFAILSYYFFFLAIFHHFPPPSKAPCPINFILLHQIAFMVLTIGFAFVCVIIGCIRKLVAMDKEAAKEDRMNLVV